MSETTTAVALRGTTRTGGEMLQGHQYLAFTLRSEIFAIDILQIREIIEFGSLTEVPMMPAAVCGVINLRGSVVPVIDLSARFGRPTTEIGKRTCIVIVEIADDEGTQTLGVLVDAVNEVMEIPASEIEPPPTFGARVRADFLAGMGRVDGRFVIILDVGKVFSVAEIAQLGAIAESS